MGTAKLRKIDTIKALSPAELELLNRNFWDIEQALNSVGAVTPQAGGSPQTGGESPSVIPIRHDQLLELNDDDHLQYLLLNGRSGGQRIQAINPKEHTLIIDALEGAYPQYARYVDCYSIKPNGTRSLGLAIARGYGYTGGITIYDDAEIPLALIGTYVGGIPFIWSMKSSNPVLYLACSTGNIVVGVTQAGGIETYGQSDTVLLKLSSVSGQTLDFQQWMDDDGNIRAKVDKDGYLITNIVRGITQSQDLSLEDYDSFAKVIVRSASYGGSKRAGECYIYLKDSTYTPTRGFGYDIYPCHESYQNPLYKESLILNITTGINNPQLWSIGRILFSGSNDGTLPVIRVIGDPTDTIPQTGDLTQWLANNGSVIAKVDKDGKITAPYFIGDGSLLTNIPASAVTGLGDLASLDTVDASKIDNRTRSIWIPWRDWTDTTGSSLYGTLFGTPPSSYVAPGWDSFTTWPYIADVQWPSDLYLTSNPVFKIYFTTDGTNNTNKKVHFDLLCRSAADGDSYIAASDFALSVEPVVSGVQHKLQVATFTGTPSNLDVSRLMRLLIQRDVDDADDTNPDTMYFLGLRIEYTADM